MTVETRLGSVPFGERTLAEPEVRVRADDYQRDEWVDRAAGDPYDDSRHWKVNGSVSVQAFRPYQPSGNYAQGAIVSLGTYGIFGHATKVLTPEQAEAVGKQLIVAAEQARTLTEAARRV